MTRILAALLLLAPNVALAQQDTRALYGQHCADGSRSDYCNTLRAILDEESRFIRTPEQEARERELRERGCVIDPTVVLLTNPPQPRWVCP